MTVYVLILQPDLDWDHQADFMGVFSTKEAAWAAATGAGESRNHDWQVYEADIDVRLPFGARNNCHPLPSPFPRTVWS